MIWYLLYPFRGTTEAPDLAPDHPLRAVFARYGRYVARHVLTALLISVTVASVLIYPFPFLYTTDFTNGASNLPHHVWTDAQLLEEKSTVETDVVMRHIWVHGGYMQALNSEVLLGALELQDQLLGSTLNFNPRQAPGTVDLPDSPISSLTTKQRDSFHVINGLTNSSWFFHSPLQYWGSSEDLVQADEDILATVNEKKTQPTSVNVTLRHSIVFSGKRFEDRRLVAADALVITLIHRKHSPVGQIWQVKAAELARTMTRKWDVYPADGTSMQSQIYEFQFRPMSAQDTLVLTMAYVLTFSYFMISLSKLRAVKSKFGLVITVLAQLFLSILSSFTICALLKIDLSRIPRFAYPVVIFSMSLENIFRLINAVILTPAEDGLSSRIGFAFGQTTHVALASVAQNLLILWGLSKVVSPGVAAFCTFAAIAIILDFFYLSTFFLSVLSVDVRRTELGDALAKASLREQRIDSESKVRQTWWDAMLQGRVALSTRIAGTIVMLGFVLIAQWHFFENESVMSTLGRMSGPWSIQRPAATPRSSLHIDIHQARSPTSWLRLQDHETAREVINVVKPGAHSYTARVYDPLIFVLKGADRMLSTKERPFIPAVYDFARHQSTPFFVTVLVVVAAVRLLMNYLLWDELQNSDENDGGEDEALLSVQTFSGGHSLDVALLCTCPDGHIISVGLDRNIQVWDVKSGGSFYPLLDEGPVKISFPILAMCTSDDSHWLALLAVGEILLWDLRERQWRPSIQIEPSRQKPEAFLLRTDTTAGPPSMIIVQRDGVIVEARADNEEVISSAIPGERVIVSAGTSVGQDSTRIVVSTRDGQVFALTQSPSGWHTNVVGITCARDQEFMSIVMLPELGFFLVAQAQSVDLVDASTYVVAHTFKTDPILPKSLKCFHSKRKQLRSGGRGLSFLTLAYLNSYTRDLVVQTYQPQQDDEAILLEPAQQMLDKTCCQWPAAKETRRVIEAPGSWAALPSGFLMGVRRKPAGKARQNATPPASPSLTGGMRRRHPQQKGKLQVTRAQGDWEVWMLSQVGKIETWETMPLSDKDVDEEHLFVNHLGPLARIGRVSLALGLGNVIKVVMLGHDRFEVEKDQAALDEGQRAAAGRRRNKPSTLRGRPPGLS